MLSSLGGKELMLLMVGGRVMVNVGKVRCLGKGERSRRCFYDALPWFETLFIIVLRELYYRAN